MGQARGYLRFPRIPGERALRVPSSTVPVAVHIRGLRLLPPRDGRTLLADKPTHIFTAARRHGAAALASSTSEVANTHITDTSRPQTLSSTVESERWVVLKNTPGLVPPRAGRAAPLPFLPIENA